MEDLKTMPKKIENLINTSNKYSDFFNKLRDEIEKNITKRIESKLVDLAKPKKMDKERIF